MGFPVQNIPESQKNREWQINCTKSIVEMALSNPYAKMKDRMCYNLLNGIIDENFDYLTKVGDFQFPARFRFIPLLRPRIDRLQTEEIQRPLVYRVMTVDQESLSRKKDEAIQRILSFAKILYNQKITMGQQMMSGMQQRAQQSPEMQQQAGQLGQQIQDQMKITMDDMDKVAAALKVRPGDLREIIMYKGLQKYLDQKNMYELFNTAFMDLCVTDKEYYMVDYPGGGRDPVVKLLRVEDFWHSADANTDYVDECEMACFRERMTPTRILDEFGDELKANGDLDHIESLRNSWTVDTSDIYPNERLFMQPNLDACAPGFGLYAGSETISNTIDVWRVEWRSCRGKSFKQSPNPYNESSQFTHYVDNAEDEKLRKGETLTKRYINDVWRGTQIGNGIYVALGKRKWQLRNPDSPSTTYLSFTGPSYGRRQRKPNSLVWMAKDIQVLYCLLFYHHELWLALAGVKGAVMDRSQKPQGMSDAEWQYARKMGTMWIQTTAAGRQISSFNQFQNYDDSLPPTIVYLRDMMIQLEDMISSITGVSRQRLGQTKENDLVGTTQQSIYESSMVTGMLFYRHERIKKRVMTTLANLCSIAWADGKTLVESENADEIIDIPPNLLNGSYYEVIIENGMKQEKILGDVRTLAAQDHQKGQISLAEVLKLYSIESVKELEMTIDKMQELAERKMQNQAQGEQDHETQLKQMDASVQQKAAEQASMLAQMKLELDKVKAQLDTQNAQADREEGGRQADQEDDTKRLDIASERATELDYLRQQELQNQRENALREKEIAAKAKSEKAKPQPAKTKATSPANKKEHLKN